MWWASVVCYKRVTPGNVLGSALFIVSEGIPFDRMIVLPSKLEHHLYSPKWAVAYCMPVSWQWIEIMSEIKEKAHIHHEEPANYQ